MRTVTVSHNWYSFPRCSGTAVPTVFGVLSNVLCQDWGGMCRAWSGLVGMESGLGHSLTLCLPTSLMILIQVPIAQPHQPLCPSLQPCKTQAQNPQCQRHLTLLGHQHNPPHIPAAVQCVMPPNDPLVSICVAHLKSHRQRLMMAQQSSNVLSLVAKPFGLVEYIGNTTVTHRNL